MKKAWSVRRWLQFRLRTVFVLTAVCAATIALLQRAQKLRETARKHEIEWSMADGHAEFVLCYRRYYDPFTGTRWPPTPASQKLSNEWRLIADHHKRLRDKCHAAIWQPWVLLNPDPPRPPEPDWPRIIR